MRNLPILASLLLLGTCTAGGPETETPSARDHLIDTVPMMNVLTEQSSATLTLRYGGPSTATQVEIGDGLIELSASITGDLRVESVNLDLGTIAAGDKGLPPTGLQLRKVHLRTDTQHSCDAVSWADDNESCEASASPELMLEGEMHMSNGMWIPLSIPVETSMDIFVYRGPWVSLQSEIHATGEGLYKGQARPVDVDSLTLDLELVEAVFAD